jgi:hypothetical protein
MKKYLVYLRTTFLIALATSAQVVSAQNIQWWQEARFGMFIILEYTAYLQEESG